jgi:Aspartyl protease
MLGVRNLGGGAPVNKPKRKSSTRNRNMQTILVAALCCIAWPGKSVAQGSTDRASLFARSDVCAPGTVPLKMHDGIALATVRVNGRPLVFIVDSAGTTMINADHVALPIVGEIQTSPVTVSSAEPMNSWKVVKIQTLGLGKKELRDMNVLSRSLPQLEAQLKTEVDGILGADVLGGWDSVALDYRKKTMTLESSQCALRKQDEIPAFTGTLSIQRRQ